ncbi:MAG: DUF6992 family protein [Bacteroidota bacterium]
MLKSFFIHIALFSGLSVFSQTNNPETYAARQEVIEHRSMITLAGWGGSNLVIGGIGWATAEGEAKYFHQMNAAWGAINLGIALPSLLRHQETADSHQSIIQRQYTTEKILLLNTGLDAAYVSTGFLLRSLAHKNPSSAEQLEGFGNAVLVQGGFLLLFDLTQYFIHQNHRKKQPDAFWGNLSMSPNGIGLRYTID